MKSLSLQACYARAWKSFSRWWIPLCLISTAILFFEVGPRLMVHDEMKAVTDLSMQAFHAVLDGDLQTLEQVAFDLQEHSVIYAAKLSKWVLVSLPFISLLTIVLLAFANMAVKDRREKRPFIRTVWIAVVHVLVAVVKGFAFLFFVLPGVYLYVRLLFVSLVMLEDESVGVGAAICKSWQITRGSFWKLLALVCLNTLFQLGAAPTIIGLIPVTGFANTARAASFQMLREESASVA